MRSVLALLFSWFFPPRGKRRAPSMVSTHDTADVPTQRLIISRAGVGLPNPPAYLRGEDIPLIRPYLIAYERAHGIYHQEVVA